MIDALLFNITQRVISLVVEGDPSGIVGQQPTGTTPIPSGDVVNNIANGVGEAVNNVGAGGGAAQAAAETGNPMWIMLVYAGVLILVMYFLMFRGPRKREKKMKEMQASIRTGDNVIVTGGMFGRIADVGEDCFVVEFGTNRGIRIPVLKSDVLGVREPKLTPPPKIEVDTDK